MARNTLIHAAVLAMLAGSAQASTELINNGSFEAEVLASGTWATYPNLTGWTGGAHGIELRNNVAGTAYDGQNFVELDTSANSSMSQTVATVAGQQYSLSFAFSPRENLGIKSNGIKVYWDNALVGSYTAAGGPNGNIWSTESLILTGKGNASLLTFKAFGSSDSLGSSLDAVSLTAAVPEPETYAMLMAGLAMMGLVARRRKV